MDGIAQVFHRAHMVDDGKWSVSASDMAVNTWNPIRQIVDNLTVKGNAAKPLISLSIGDPTVFKNLQRPKTATQAVLNSLNADHSFDGYPPAIGYSWVRKQLAEFMNKECYESAGNAFSVGENDVILTSGCSHALDLAISAICNPGDSILIPKPCFPLYMTICKTYGFRIKSYDLNPDRSWEIDFESAAAAIDDKTKAILINNPSNPCGSVFSAEHIKEIIAFAEKHRLPIIADEIYANIVFSGFSFHYAARFTSRVPIISVGGIAKQFLVPGWRLGWIILHDRNGILKEYSKGVKMLAQIILGPSSLIQASLPYILEHTGNDFYQSLNTTLENQANACIALLKSVPGLRPVAPQGAMYVMVEVLIDQFHDIKDDVDFCKKLLEAENVMVLPGQAFNAPNFFRIVICAPHPVLTEAFERIQEFCQRNLKNKKARTN